jgi:membrane-associated phospholipid phosphatase
MVTVAARAELHRRGRPVRGALLPAPSSRSAAALLVVSVATTVLLGLRYAHQVRPGRLDTAFDPRIRSVLDGHPVVLGLVRLGDPLAVTAMAAILVATCLAAQRWRAAVLVVVAVPTASAITELVLKPLVHRIIGDGLSFPSGHVTGAFALAVTYAVLLVNPPRPRLAARLRVLLGLGGIVAASAVAVATVAVRAHYTTDTVGGAAVATSVVLLTALVLDRIPELTVRGRGSNCKD